MINNPSKNQWVIGVFADYSPGYVMNDGIEQSVISIWRNQMNITPMLTSDLIPFKNIPDPLVAKTFEKYPDMAERFERFLAGDLSALSEPGIILLTKIAKMNVYR
jgi:hypothetical protein